MSHNKSPSLSPTELHDSVSLLAMGHSHISTVNGIYGNKKL